MRVESTKTESTFKGFKSLAKHGDYESINNLSAQALQTLPLFVPAMQFAIASRYKRSCVSPLKPPGGSSVALIAVMRTELEVNCVERFFTLLSEQEVAGGLDDIFVFEKKVGSTFIPSPETGSQPDKLELLTMHKSKGLEFDHVLLQASPKVQSTMTKTCLYGMSV